MRLPLRFPSVLHYILYITDPDLLQLVYMHVTQQSLLIYKINRLCMVLSTCVETPRSLGNPGSATEGTMSFT